MKVRSVAIRNFKAFWERVELELSPSCTFLIGKNNAGKTATLDSLALAVVKGLSHLAPHVHVLNLRSEDFSRDPAAVKAMLDDPLIAGEVQPTNTVAELARADERLEREFPQITLPLLILHGTADKVTKPSGSQFFHETAGSADKTLKLYEGHAHDLLNDLGREGVMADIAAWIERRLPGA